MTEHEIERRLMEFFFSKKIAVGRDAGDYHILIVRDPTRNGVGSLFSGCQLAQAGESCMTFERLDLSEIAKALL